MKIYGAGNIDAACPQARMIGFPHFDPHFPRAEWTLPHVMRSQAALRPDRPFLRWRDDGASWTFGETDRMTNRVANGLAESGVGRGEMVGLLLPNCPEFVFLIFGLMKIGAVEVAISDAYKGGFLAHPLTLSQARILVTTAALAGRIAEIEEDLPALERIFILNVDGDDITPPRFNRIAVDPYERLVSDDERDPNVTLDPSERAAVLMTSGTTGPSKGVVMSHSHYYFFAEENVQLTRLGEDDVYMTGFPLYHGNAQFLTVYPALIAGAQVVLYPRFSASDWAGRAKRSGATVTNLLGATMSFILAHPASADDRAHRLRTIYAAPLAPDLGRHFTDRFGVGDYVDGFGQTEISNVFMTPPDVPRPDGASGVLVDQWFEVKLVDPESGEPVSEGQPGELLVRPRAHGIICSEYLGMPDKTVETWRDLWFHTGDSLRRDETGWYYFVDRVKDALRRRGENISSFEVEEGVRSHPAVAACAVIGVRADEAAGEDEVMACVVLKDGARSSHVEIAEWCSRTLPAFMVPRYIDILTALPVTASEKVKKKDLRDRGVTAATWDRQASGVKAG